VKTARQRHAEWRETRLKEIQEDIEAGTLVVRQMTRRQDRPRPGVASSGAPSDDFADIRLTLKQP
jgi:hypothetical protein